MQQTPTEITFRDMTPSPALETAIESRVRRLGELFDLVRCTVVVEQPHKHQRRGRTFHVQLAITVPGGEVVVSRDDAPGHVDPYLTVADAFRLARRRLQGFIESRRERVTRAAS